MPSRLPEPLGTLSHTALRRGTKPPEKPWKWRLECLVHSLIERLAGLLPAAALFRAGEALGGLAWHLLPGRRAIVRRNLRIAFAGEKMPAELEALARAAFRRTGGNMLSVARTARLDRARLNACVELRGFEHIRAALDHGRGVVILIPHMGNWEVLSRINLLMPEGVGTGAFYRPLNNPLMDARVLARRQADGTRMFSKHDGPLQATGFLRSNAMLGILADQRTGMAGEPVRFFGRLTRASPLPGLLARRVKCPMLVLANTTLKPGSWRVEFSPVGPPFTTAACMDAMETAMKSSPADYFWLQDRWKIYLRNGQTIRDWLGPEDGTPGKAHRALLWLTRAPQSWTLPDAWKHADVTYEAVLTESQEPPATLHPDTRIHRVSSSGDRTTLRRQLAAIDAAAALPVDFILAPHAPKALAKAGRLEQIPVVDPAL